MPLGVGSHGILLGCGIPQDLAQKILNPMPTLIDLKEPYRSIGSGILWDPLGSCWDPTLHTYVQAGLYCRLCRFVGFLVAVCRSVGQSVFKSVCRYESCIYTIVRIIHMYEIIHILKPQPSRIMYNTYYLLYVV